MTILRLDHFMSAIQAWAAGREDDFPHLWPVKGGYEGWVQVDLIAFILSYDHSIDIRREQPVFVNGRQRVDLLVNPQCAMEGAPEETICVEIKAQSFENHARFVSGVMEDVEKLDASRDRLHERSSGVALAIAFSPEAQDQLRGMRFGDAGLFHSIYSTQEFAVFVAVWREGHGWVQSWPGNLAELPRPSVEGPRSPC